MSTGKKIEVLINDEPDSLSALKFAESFFNDARNLITIIYLVNYPSKNDTSGGLKIMRPTEVRSPELREKLETYALNASHSIHQAKIILKKQYGTELEVFKWQCTFADLLVTTQSSLITLSEVFGRTYPFAENGFRCSPVITVPTDFSEIENILIAYSTESNGISAIKQFCYIFQEICSEYDVNLLQVFDNGMNPLHVQEERLFVQYLKQHCQRLAIHKYIGGEPLEILRNHLDFSSRTLVVTNDRLVEKVAGLLGVTTAASTDNNLSSTQFIAY